MKNHTFPPAKTLPLMVAALLCLSGQAMAQHDDPDPTGTADQPTTQTLSPLLQASSTVETVNAAFDRLAFLSMARPFGQSGVSSGNAPYGINLWANPYYSHARDTNLSTGYNSDTWGAFFGGDAKIANDWTVGLMIGVDQTDVNSKVNGGGSDSFGITVAPYARYTLDKNYSADVTLGYTSSNSDNDRIASGTRITGSSDLSRFFTAVGMNGSFWYDRWNFTGRVGTSNSFDDRDSYKESDNTLIAGSSSSFGQFQLGTTVGYYFERVRPWVSVTYAYDYDRELPKVGVGQTTPSDDRNQMILGYGVSVFNIGPVTADVSVKHTLFKEKYDNTNVGLSLSTSF